MAAVRFILGRAGTGKTTWCAERISAELKKQALGGSGIFWILPRQATFQAQRMLADKLGGYFRVECLDFSDLARRVVAETGGEAAGEVTELGRRIILGHLLRTSAKELTFFANVAHHPGAAAELDRTFSEIEQTGRDMQELRQAVGEISAEPALAAKVRDLELLYGKYQEFLGRERVDPTRRLARALAGIVQCRSLRGALILVDGFFDFTAFERKVLAGLAQVAGEMNVTLTVDPAADCIGNPHHAPEEMSLFHRTEETFRKLHFAFSSAGIQIEKPLVLDSTRRFLSAGLKELEHWESPGKIAGGVEMAEAPNRRGEVDSAARWILQWTRQGYRYRDIAVLMRDEPEYRELIEMSFGEHGIPFFADRRRTAGHHPLVRLIRAVIGIAAQRWPTESVIAAVKTGLAGLSAQESDFLENAVLRFGISHQRWMENWNDAQAEELRRGIVEKIGPFAALALGNPRRGVSEWTAGLVAVLESLGVRATIVKWMQEAEKTGRLEERGEHERLWSATAELLDTLVELLGEQRMPIADFAGVMDAALEGFDLAIAPPTVDQVMVGSVDRTRTGTVRAAVVLGLDEGQFPRGHHETSLFSDADRRLLRAREIDLDPDADRKLLDEEFWAYQAFTRASEHVLVTRATGDEAGKERNASLYWDRIEQRVGTPPKPTASAICSPRQLVSALMRWARDPHPKAHGRQSVGSPPDKNPANWPAIYSWFTTQTHNPALELLKRTAWKALLPHPKATLSNESAATLARDHLSVTELESFAACPFQHFAKSTLDLKKRDIWEVGAADVTHLYRAVLEKWAREMMATGKTWDQDVAWREEIDRWIDQTGKQWREKLLMATAQHRYVLGRARKVLEMVAAAQRAMGRRGLFRVAEAGRKYAMEIITPTGKHVVVGGKVDRVDRAPDGSVCTVDYRWETSKPGITELFFGLSLRMAAGLLAITGDKPGAALMVQLSRPAKKGDTAEGPGPGEEAFDLAIKPRGIIDAKVLNLLDRNIDKGGQSDVMNVYINKNGELGRIENSDAFTSEELAALLEHAKEEMGRIADRILAGEIEVRPYRLGKVTACARCAYQDVCRFEPAPGAYNDLPLISRSELAERGKS